MNRRRPSTLTICLLTLAVITLIILRHDFWNWHKVSPIGFLPIGLWWQILVTLLSSLVMWLLVTFAWPAHLEQEAYEAEQKRTKNEDGG
jgi:uncharacterized membrane protein